LLGDKTFGQCAGFMRIMEGDHPLDRSCFHPEAYPVVERILAHTKVNICKLIGSSHHLGEITVSNIIEKFNKPDHDPRPEFKTTLFKDGVEKISNLTVGMILEGVVTNVANFGAFVDVGVHQDGLVYISELADVFVKDRGIVVKLGDVVQVNVQKIDLPRKRISLAMEMVEVQARPLGKEKHEKKYNPSSKD
jgi:uncharacterized protein